MLTRCDYWISQLIKKERILITKNGKFKINELIYNRNDFKIKI